VKSTQSEEFVYQAVLSGDLEIDDEGRIWRLRKRGWDRWKGTAVSRPCKRVRAERVSGNRRQYLQVCVMLDGTRRYALAHRLVWFHHKGSIPADLTINHKDGRHSRNCIENLELATYTEQQLHACHVLKVGHACNQNGSQNNMAVLTRAQFEEIIRRRKAGEKLLSIANDFGIRFQHVSKLARGERWVSALEVKYGQV
jgi:hypothetical protein